MTGRRAGRQTARRRAPTRRLALAAGVVLAGIAVAAVAVRPVRWAALQRGLDARAAVPWVTPDRLAAELAGDAPPLVLDVRPDPEFAVGHLPGARRVDPDADGAALAAVLAEQHAGRRVVLYCSVGARSGSLGRRLRDAGLDGVRNLRGGVFRWAADGRPLRTAAGAPTRRVHPYNRLWGRYLPAANRAPLGGAEGAAAGRGGSPAGGAR